MSLRGGLSVQPKDGGKSQFEFDRSKMSGTLQIAAIGDDAFAFRSLAGFVQINVLKGNHYVVIILQGQTAGDQLQAAEAIARTISSRM